MTESSLPWPTDGTGDGTSGGYTADELRNLLTSLGSGEGANVGVIGGYLNSLEPSSPGADEIRSETGRAQVDGTLYINTAQRTLDVSRPTVGQTGKKLVLQKGWSAQTVRLAVISSSDGVATLPSLTQTDGTTWEIPLCSFLHETSGSIGSIVDLREFTRPFFLAIVIDGSGTVLTTGVKIEAIAIPQFTITGWQVVGDQSGSVVIDIAHKSTFAIPAFPGDSIAGSEKPTLSSAQTAQDLSIETWTRNLVAGQLAVKFDSLATLTRVNLTLRGYRP